jgi:uncharacterized DUF497 family protein
LGQTSFYPGDLEWSDGVDDHLARHGLTYEDVEEALYEGNPRASRNKSGHPPDHHLFVGHARGGRTLAIILRNVGHPRWRVISAWDAPPWLHRRYRRDIGATGAE